MAQSQGGSLGRRRARDQARAGNMRDVVRTTQRCPQCYRIISAESRKSRYTHICR